MTHADDVVAHAASGSPGGTLASSPASAGGAEDARARREWWRDAVIYQIYPRSFRDSSGSGIGDLRGVCEELPKLAHLGIDAIWLSPFFTSPQKDAGYDVADYKGVDPIFGDLDDFDEMLAEAHALGVKVIIDLVPNHSSDQHEWFQEALRAKPGSRERARYIFRNGRGAGGDEPPNNWESVFGGRAWTRIDEPDGTPGQWYLHLFDRSQPDFDWTSEEVREHFRGILRFWLDRGVDGFRVDVAHGLVKAEGLPDYTPDPEGGSMGGGESDVPYWGQDGVHEIYRDWHALLAEYDGDRAMCGEAWLPTLEQTARWVRPGEMHQTFNFVYLETDWNGPKQRAVIDESLKAFGSVGAPATWVLSNHDVIRHASRLGLAHDVPQGFGIGPASPEKPDETLGLRRARAATALMLALPGSAYLYNGEELGLPEVIDLPDDARQDPTWHRTNHERYGRDGCRVPLPWHGDHPSYGFNQTGAAWLPQPASWARLSRERQEGDPASTLELYRTLLAARRAHRLGDGALDWLTGYPSEVVAFTNGDVAVIANASSSPVPLLPEHAHLAELAHSLPDALREGEDATRLAPDATVWLLLG